MAMLSDDKVGLRNRTLVASAAVDNRVNEAFSPFFLFSFSLVSHAEPDADPDPG